jgi:hypothetical protein
MRQRSEAAARIALVAVMASLCWTSCMKKSAEGAREAPVQPVPTPAADASATPTRNDRVPAPVRSATPTDTPAPSSSPASPPTASAAATSHAAAETLPIAVPGPDLAALLAPTKQTLHRVYRQKWPPTPWATAKAYTYNFVPYGPRAGKLRVYDGKWSTNVQQTIALSKEQADAALELTHRTAGEMLTSKCAFPRHAVVFFDEQGKAVASVNVCFSCTDILVWPPYGREALQAKKYGNLKKLLAVHDEVLARWRLFFDDVGAEQYKKR